MRMTLLILLSLAFPLKMSLAGVEIGNFHKVVGIGSGPRLYRSAMPDKVGLVSLLNEKFLHPSQLTVISLHDKLQDAEKERAICREMGIGFYWRPIYHLAVQDEAYIDSQILDLIDSELHQGWSVLVHCWAGEDRTGLIIGLYRTLRQIGRWSPENAWSEMLHYGFHKKFATLWGHFNYKNGISIGLPVEPAHRCEDLLQ